jgi:hypothetical protein
MTGLNITGKFIVVFAQIAKKFFVFFRIQRFITVFRNILTQS